MPPLSPWLIFRIWLLIGIQSFGGGVATTAIIRQVAVERRKWITDEEFLRDFALCQLAPGINLIAISILIGKRTAGFLGAILAPIGMVVPSAIVTVAMTALYSRFAHASGVQHAVSGIIPGTIGLGLWTAVSLGRPILKQGWKEGLAAFILSAAILVASAAGVVAWKLPVVYVLVGGGLILGLANMARERRATTA